MDKKELKLIGIIDEYTCSSQETQEQIDEVIKNKINIFDDNESISWDAVYDRTNKDNKVLFNSIIEDRKKRVDQKQKLADRPRFAVCTIIDNVCERIEFYEGHDRLEKTFDLRSKRLIDEEIEDYLKSDEYGYNPMEFLKQFGLIKGIDDKKISDILEILHSTTTEDELKEKIDQYLRNKDDK